MNTENGPITAAFEKARRSTQQREWNRDLDEVVRLIDKLSGEMSQWPFIHAMRERGYDICADTSCIERLRRVSIN